VRREVLPRDFQESSEKRGLGSGAVAWQLLPKSSIPIPLPDEALPFLLACPEAQGFDAR
jgi:hypothetical protein